MIMRFGMSEKLGPRVLGRSHEMPFLGRDMGSEPDYSEELAKEIDDEIRRVIEEAHDSADRVLRQHMDDLHRLSAILIERETIDNGPVRAPARRRGRGVDLPGGGAGDRGARGRRREAPQAPPAATAHPRHGGHAAAAAGSGRELARRRRLGFGQPLYGQAPELGFRSS